MSIEEQIKQARALRRDKPEEALKILKALLPSEDPDLNYAIASTCDFMGKESEAAPYYEKAIAGGLKTDRVGAMLGLGSTYRCLGEYEKSLRILDQAVAEFPDARALRVFRALTQYNLGKFEDSVSALLVQLIDTTSDSEIKAYDGALRFYSDKLNQTWK